eukprot:Hpha_TRINITY_DN13424_c0_g2::TRINITY_DN13424_c0_g2_i1::g.131163::m.131163
MELHHRGVGAVIVVLNFVTPAYGVTRTVTNPPPTPTVSFLAPEATTCANFNCSGLELANHSWNWMGAGGLCLGDACTEVECCTTAESLQFAPEYAGYENCEVHDDLWGSVGYRSYEECWSDCDNNKDCWGFWSDRKVCKLMLAGPLQHCTTPLHTCDKCQFWTRVLMPWFAVRSHPTMEACQPSGELRLVYNITPAACQALCDDLVDDGCNMAAYRRYSPFWYVNPISGRWRSAWDWEYTPFHSTCRLYRNPLNATCSDSAEKVCHPNSTCFYERTATAWNCQETPVAYLSHSGPLVCLSVLGSLAISTLVFTCVSVSKGASDSVKENRKFFGRLLLIVAAPLLFFGFICAYIPGLRDSMLHICQGRVNPSWGANTLYDELEDTTDFDADGSAVLRWHKAEEGTQECHEENEDGHIWELPGCFAPAAWGQGWAHLPPPGSMIWNMTFHPDMPFIGSYDISFRCGWRPEDIRTHPRRIISPNILDGTEQRLMQITQFQTKDGKCDGPTWEILMGERECLESLGSLGDDLMVSAVCSSCEWLRWEAVKNAPYQMMMINSLCSLVFSGILALVFDTIIPMFGNKIAKSCPWFAVNCRCFTTTSDDMDEDWHFCPCAPNEERRIDMVGQEMVWAEQEDDEYPIGPACCSAAEQKLTCSNFRCLGLCDLEEDWTDTPRSDRESYWDDDVQDGLTDGSLATTQTPTGTSHHGTSHHGDRTSPRGGRRHPLTPSGQNLSRATTPRGSWDSRTPRRDPGLQTPRQKSFAPTNPRNEPFAEDYEDEEGDITFAEGDMTFADSSSITEDGHRYQSSVRGSIPTMARTQAPSSYYIDERTAATVGTEKQLRLPTRRHGCCRCKYMFRYWADNIWRWISDNQESITEGIIDDLHKHEGALQFARSRSAPSFAFVLIKTVYFFFFLTIDLMESSEDTRLSKWDRYQILYMRLCNSGIMLLLIECIRVVDANLQHIRANTMKREDMRKTHISFGLTIALAASYLPAFLTHIIPMGVVYVWVLLLLYVFGYKVLLKWPTYLIDSKLANDWEHRVENTPYRMLAVAHFLGLYQKFSGSFLMVLPVQMLYNYGVVLYSMSVPYWEIPIREYRSRTWSCFFETSKDEDLADKLQLYSFYF